MQLVHRIENKLCIVSIIGSLSFGEVKEAQQYINPFLNDLEIQGFILNLEQMDFMDSKGVAWIAALQQDLKSLQKTLAFCHINKKSIDVLEMIGMKKILNIFETEESAVSALAEN